MNRRNFFRALSAVLSFIGIGATAKSGFTCAGCGSIKTSSVGGGFTRTLEGGRPFWCPDCLHPTERNVDIAKLQRQTVEGMRQRVKYRVELAQMRTPNYQRLSGGISDLEGFVEWKKEFDKYEEDARQLCRSSGAHEREMWNTFWVKRESWSDFKLWVDHERAVRANWINL